ncbi:hypothetical protein PPYR_08306 [Photinus pyralis]|uniref:Major facilitator superfamily (MFS) profile domain-containing protein n=2 Tax=Photinus pyralis TaxID=7054 RepID=A0A5N4AIY8_PHOPY|nr:solute carrier family 2, facilitated glucose transporter member 1-like isoform X1 [Photinus pyralis]XP_031344099.1 solute carrier family 2, facilitated glucose transporter member 1-like isoform X1 [Photinus pyralis]KAB0797312.1 hypothetical protein PPYR_08306 [Photinus pyralis]
MDSETRGLEKKGDNSDPSASLTPKEEVSFTGRLAFAIAASAIGSAFQHGYNTGVLNNPEQVMKEWIKDVMTNRTNEIPEPEQLTVTWSVIVAIFCFGGMIGGMLTGTIADRFGRKGGLLLNNIFVLIAVVLECAAKPARSYEMIAAGRFFIGINSGLNAGLTPMYLAEISPVNLRGAVGTVYQLVITISIFIAQVLGLEYILGGDRWPTLLAMTIVPAIFQVVTLPMCPETPKFLLLSRGKEVEAQRALTWLRGSVAVSDEMNEMRAEFEAVKLVPKATMKELFTNSALRIPLIIALTMMIAQQLSGINAIMYFSTQIFTDAHLKPDDAQYATLGMGGLNVFMTLVSLILVEKAGRKTLLLVGFAGMTIDVFVLIFTMIYSKESQFARYMCIVLILIYIILFASGPGSIPWFLVGELFNQSARPMATSLAVMTNWAANFAVGLGFPLIRDAIGPYVFVIFVVCLALSTVFIYKKVPETKNKTIEEIAAMFRQQSYQ